MHHINWSGEKVNIISTFRWIFITCLLLVVIIYIETNCLTIAVVRGNSMYPTLRDGEILLVNRRNTIPELGEIVLIKTPDTYQDSEYIVKRVIATGGETVSIDYNKNIVLVNGISIVELYINIENIDPMENDDHLSVVNYVVPDGYIFVMGDNRNFSIDSRSEKIGFIPETDIMGKVITSY